MNKSFPNNNRLSAVTVDSLGMHGDGIANADGKRYFIPYAAPGDILDLRIGARREDGHVATIYTIIRGGPGRTAPACRHFETCGGCTLQHIETATVAAIKRDLIAVALSRHGFRDLTIMPAISVPPGQRRRVRFAFFRAQKNAFGFSAARSNQVVDIAECPVTRPAITALIAPLKALAANIASLGRRAEFLVTETDSGIDLLLRPDKPADPGLDERMALAAFAERHDLARIGWDAPQGYEPLAARRAPEVAFGAARVALPPNAFLQPSRDGERAIVDAVCAAAAGSKNIADLYAGCGALSFPLSAIAPVHAFEGDAEMVQAIRRADSKRVVTAEIRDLARQPLRQAELKNFDTVVFDPPRAGAKTQAAAIAESGAATVIAVSCNPATLARDLRLLADGGYRIESVQPIDQFPWSAHVEAVAVLRR